MAYAVFTPNESSRVESSESFDSSKIDSLLFTLKDSGGVKFISSLSDVNEYGHIISCCFFACLPVSLSVWLFVSL